MTAHNVRTMTVDELVQLFAAIAIEQDWAIFDENNRKYNRLFDQMMEVKDELKSRQGDQRSALVALYNHRNVQVRLMAARLSMDLTPSEARPVLETIAKSGAYPQAADAGFALDRLDGHPIVP